MVPDSSVVVSSVVVGMTVVVVDGSGAGSAVVSGPAVSGFLK